MHAYVLAKGSRDITQENFALLRLNLETVLTENYEVAKRSSWWVALRLSLPPPGSVSAGKFEGHLLPIDHGCIIPGISMLPLASQTSSMTYVYHFDLHLRISQFHGNFARHKSGPWSCLNIYHVRYVNMFLNNDHNVVEESYASICASVKRD